REPLSGRVRLLPDSAGSLDLRNLLLAEAEHIAQDLVRVLPEQRRAHDLGAAVRQLDRIADREVFAARWMIDLYHGARRAERLVFCKLLHREDRAARNIVLVQ